MSPAFDIYSGLKQLNQSTDINLSTAQYKKIEKYLAPYDLTLESKLSDAMFSGNHLTKDKVTGLQSNFYELYLKQVEIEYNSAKDKQLFLEDLITKKTNSYLYDVQEYNHEVLKPLKFWEHQAVAFNCIYNSYDPQLYDLLYYIVKSEPDLDVYIDSFSVGDALHRLSQGAADAFIARWAKHQIQTNALHESTKINIKQDSMLKIPITIPNQQLYYTLNTDSVKWEVITDLFNALKNKQYIGHHTKAKDFKSIFYSENSKYDKGQSITWRGSNQSLKFFVQQLQKRKIILGLNIWLITSNCFNDANGKPFTAQQLQKTASNPDPVLEQLIDTHLKNHIRS